MYAYKNEDETEHWGLAKEALKVSFDTEKSKELNIDNLNTWEQGRYKLVLKTKDKYGVPIEVTKFFSIYSSKETSTPLNEALFLAKNTYYNTEPGTTINLDVGSHNKAAYVLYEIEHDKQIIHKEWLQPKGRTSLPIKIEEKHRGNVHFHLTSIQNGCFYNTGGSIYVPWSNKDLKIEYATFRDKLYPGQEEEWKIKISGTKGDKVAAEFLAGMYDASLDAFASNYWGFNVHPTDYRSLNLTGYYSFTYVSSSLHQDLERVLLSLPLYLRLSWSY